MRIGELARRTGYSRQTLSQIEDGRIAAVGPAQAFGTALGDGACVVDFSSHVLMPGIVDCHAHPTRPSDSRSPDEQLSVPDEMLALTAVAQLTRHLRSGVTTVRDCNARGGAGSSRITCASVASGVSALKGGRPVRHS